MKIGFQGNKGAYSEEAARQFFGKSHQFIGHALSEEVADALHRNEIDMAILPVENSIIGNVQVNMDVLFQNNFFAFGEIYLPIKHCLLGIKGTQIQDIKKAHSHPVALSQCRNFLTQNQIKPINDYDTAGSCEVIAKLNDKSIAAIGPKLCSEIYNLDVIAEEIQNTRNNITRFLAIQKNRPQNHLSDKTSLAFSTEDRPGALLEILNLFKLHNLNLSRLESRPIPENPFEYIFFVDVLSSDQDDRVQAVLKEILSQGHLVKLLGSYQKATYH